jgi:hypothetical protein
MELYQEFFDLFKGLPRAYGLVELGEVDSRNKRKGSFRTVRESYTDSLWKNHLEGRQSFGVVPILDDGTCFFGAIDIDVYKDLRHEEFEKQIIDNKLPFVPCFTKSGGLHLYIFFKNAASAERVRKFLSEITVLLKIPKAEVFPKQSRLASYEDTGNWLNMPYFGNTRKSFFQGKELSAKDFVAYAKTKMLLDETALDQYIVQSNSSIVEGPCCLEHMERDNIPEGGRNIALFNFATYFKKSSPDNWEEKLEKINIENTDKPLPAEEILSIIKSQRKKDYAYQCDKSPLAERCNRSICAKRKFGVCSDKNDPGITINTIVKINSEPPTWIVDVDGVRISLDKTDDLKNQEGMRTRCMEKLNKLPTKIKQHEWDRVVNEALEKRLEIIEAPEDASSIGQIKIMVDRFLEENKHSEDKDALLEGTPFFENKHIYFRSTDLSSWLQKEKFTISSHKLYALLRELGCDSGSFNIKSKLVRWWSLPYDGQQLVFSQPKITGAEF